MSAEKFFHAIGLNKCSDKKLKFIRFKKRIELELRKISTAEIPDSPEGVDGLQV
ncbi:hypothetical protein [Maridesulfovibrio hydrothermalis]|uniref:Uncharacterized protein n=1 Tax=Maridesulfovibrio hydrothermalis AM13 = DSM 14728 TaxID=1121451 RepID=L0RG15_9BACT|nr:hypothetical protein [Maridesulfovibrio hydrothermalis]CCO25177.1 protein of unknown function [Maridesulfovibrio hydrothermalis AM13 = DSM 14728]